MAEPNKKMEEALEESLKRANESEKSEDYLNYINAADKIANGNKKDKGIFREVVVPVIVATVPAVIIEIVHDIFLARHTTRVLRYEKDGIIASSPGKGLTNIFKIK